jgi:hypothetical protein
MQPDNTSPDEPRPARPLVSSRGAVIHLFVTMAALAVFVWAVRPNGPNVKPAPLRPEEAACPHLEGEFTPTNFTELPGLELDSLSKEHRNHVLLRLNMEPCPCGCNTSIASCLLHHPRCQKCKELGQEIVAQEREGEDLKKP